MDLSELWMSAPAQINREMREARVQFGTPGMSIMFGLPGTLHPAYTSAFNAVLPDLCVIANKSGAEIL
eukprot:11340614-Alexandrium_andersonii.AAC.1